MTKRTNRLRIIPLLLISIIEISLYLGIALRLKLRFYSQDLDSSFFVQLIQNRNTLDEKNISSEIGSSFGGLWRFIGSSPEYWCTPNYIQNFSGTLIENHPYYIVYLLNFLKTITGFSGLDVAVYGLSAIYLLMLNVILFSILRLDLRLSVKIILSIAFLTNPLILSAIQGQLYFDKIILFVSPLVIFSLYKFYVKRKDNFVSSLFISIIITTVSERGAIFVAIISLYLLIMHLAGKYKSNEKRIKFQYFVIPLLSSIWFIFWYFFVQKSLYYSSGNYLSINSLINRFDYLIYENQESFIFPFLSFTIPIILITFIYSKSLGGLSLFLILPNMLIGIGGAELNGFFTHYHSLYAGSMWAFLILALDNNEKIVFRKRLKNLLVTIMCLALVLFTYKWFNNVGAVIRNLQGVYSPILNNEENRLKQNQFRISQIVDDLKQDQKFSISRQFMPYFANKDTKELGYFPILLGDADTVLVIKDQNDNLILDYWLISDQNRVQEVSSCLKQKLDGYPFVKSFVVDTTQISIYSKKLLLFQDN